MSLVETYLPQPVFVFSIQCVTQRSRLRVLLHFADNTYSFGVFVSVWQTAMSPVLNLIAAQQAVFEPPFPPKTATSRLPRGSAAPITNNSGERSPRERRGGIRGDYALIASSPLLMAVQVGKTATITCDQT